MKCLLDMDGVLTDFVAAMCAAHNRESPYRSARNYGEFDMYGPWGMQADEFWSVADRSFWESLPIATGAVELVGHLESLFGRENICILSSPSKNLDCVAGKITWLRQHFPAYARSFLFGPKKEFCAGPNRILVDDYDRNVDRFIEAGGRAVLVPRLWNRHYAMAHDPIAETVRALQSTLGKGI